MESNQVCSRCKGIAANHEEILFRDRVPYARYRHHASYRDLSESSSRGCLICKMLSRVLFRHAEVEGIVVELLTSALPVSILGLWLGNTKTTSITVSVQELSECRFNLSDLSALLCIAR